MFFGEQMLIKMKAQVSLVCLRLKNRNIRYSSYLEAKIHRVEIRFVPSLETCTESIKL